MSGATKRRESLRPAVLELLTESGEEGYTYWEISRITGKGHGSVSGVLSDLHKEGIATRLVQERDDCGIYVRVENAAGRPTMPYRSVKGRCPECPHCTGQYDEAV